MCGGLEQQELRGNHVLSACFVGFYREERLSFCEVAKRAQIGNVKATKRRRRCSSCRFNSVLHKTAAVPLSSLMVD